jgi:hypothetical protein
MIHCALITAALTVWASAALAADPVFTNAPVPALLLTDSLGRLKETDSCA